LTVSIVSYNTSELLHQALLALGHEHEVIVVDNASRDGSADRVEAEHPHVLLIRSPMNLGFGAAHNLAIRSASAPLILLLNSDARPLDAAVSRLVDVMTAQPELAACGGRLVFPDGSLQNSCCSSLTLWAVLCEQTLLEKALPSSRIFSPYWQTRRLIDLPGEIHEVEQVMGACLMFRKQEEFDEDFFLYVEDTELCRRLRRHGRIAYVKDAVFEHVLGASSSGSAQWKAVARYNRGKELYFKKTRGRGPMILCGLMNRMGAALRLVIWLAASCLTLFLSSRFRSKVLLFLRVMLAPIKGPDLPPDSRPSHSRVRRLDEPGHP
jgi:GT2 family glycosyltransferase